MAALSPFYSYSGCWCWVWRESHTAQPFPGCTCCTSPRQMLGLLLVQNVCAVSLVYFWCVWGREWGDSGGWSETLPARVINEPSISWATRRGGRLGQLRVDGLKNFKKFERSHCIAMKKQNRASWLLYFKHIYISCHNRWHSFSRSSVMRQLPKTIPGGLPVALVMFGLLEIKRIYETWQILVCKKWTITTSASSLPEELSDLRYLPNILVRWEFLPCRFGVLLMFYSVDNKFILIGE